MLKRYQAVVGGLFRVLDAGIIVIAWLTAYWLRFHYPLLPVSKGFPGFASYAATAPLVAVLWLTVFAVMQVYESNRMLGPVQELKRVLNAHGMALLSFVALTYVFEQYKYSRLVMIYFGVLSAVALAAFRLSMRASLRQLRKRGLNLRHILLVGEGAPAENLVERLEEFPELGLRVAGVVTSDGSALEHISGRPVLGRISQLPELIAKTAVDEVLIALPWSQNHEVPRLLGLLKDETVDIRLIPDVKAYATLRCDVEDFDGVPVVRINDSPLAGWGALAKRITDVLLSSVGLLILSPFLLLIALAIKLTTGGPALYVQERMGLDGRTFRMLKFCSMRPDAETRTGAVWARPGDDRCTALGSILRKTSLDELPQLWNVLCGDMSLVGPRPERPVFVQKFRHEVPHYMLRHKVKAGITGWAQVNGWRGNTSLRRRIECDLYYIQHWSYALDLKILTLTLWKGFINKNAY